MNNIDFMYFEGEPDALRTWLESMGWSEEIGPNSGSTDASVVSFGPVEVRSVLGQDIASKQPPAPTG